jgi:hypothetical protein
MGEREETRSYFDWTQHERVSSHQTDLFRIMGLNKQGIPKQPFGKVLLSLLALCEISLFRQNYGLPYLDVRKTVAH